MLDIRSQFIFTACINHATLLTRGPLKSVNYLHASYRDSHPINPYRFLCSISIIFFYSSYHERVPVNLKILISIDLVFACRNYPCHIRHYHRHRIFTQHCVES